MAHGNAALGVVGICGCRGIAGYGSASARGDLAGDRSVSDAVVGDVGDAGGADALADLGPICGRVPGLGLITSAPSCKPASGARELAEVAEHFNTMTDHVAQLVSDERAQLRDAEENLRRLLDNAPVGIFCVDKDGILTRVRRRRRVHREGHERPAPCLSHDPSVELAP